MINCFKDIYPMDFTIILIMRIINKIEIMMETFINQLKI